MFNTDDFFEKEQIEPLRVFERIEPVNFSTDDLIGTHIAALFIKSRINNDFDWGMRCVDWGKMLRKEIVRLRTAVFSDEAQRVIQIREIRDKIKEIRSFEPCVVDDDERSQWEDEQRAKQAKADEAEIVSFWEQYKEKQVEDMDDGFDSQEDAGCKFRTDGYGARDEDAAAWLEEAKLDFDLDSLTLPQIKAALQARDVNRDKKLWRNGFSEWNRKQQVWPKKTAGRKLCK